MHAAVRVGVAGADALATQVAVRGPLPRKRPRAAVGEGIHLAHLVVPFDVECEADTVDAYDTPVALATVEDWRTRMQPRTSLSSQHAGLVDVLVDDVRWITLPLLRTSPPGVPAHAWLLPVLALATEGVVRVYAHVTLADSRLTLSVDIHIPLSSLHRTYALPTVDALMAVCTALQTPEAPEPESGADLVYASLCRRELHADTRMPEAAQPRGLHAHLLPFQRRSVAFLLEREATWEQRRVLTGLGPWWTAVRTCEAPLYFHVLTGALTPSVDDARRDVVGAMLSEEMGLGKTVEVLALLLEHPAPERNALPPFFDVEKEVDVQPVSTTLIVAPETLRRQWLDELRKHAPDLHMYSFLGHKQVAKDVVKAGHTSWAAWAKTLDVIVVSFETLAKELAVSSKAPTRSMRRPQRYERPQSPLTQLAFWRVVMDEVQLVGGNAAKTMAMVHRHASIAVSGTPVRRLDDLRSSFGFMGLIPGATTSKAWQRIVSPALAPHLARVLSSVGIRHTKAQVAHEMVLPVQQRSLIPVEFTHTESAFYRDVYRAALEALDITEEGAPLSETWQLETGVLRAQLLRLRQACTHPHVALRAGPMLGEAATGHGLANLRSIDHVLTMMLDGARSELLTLRHNLVLRRIHRASVLLFAPIEAWHEAAPAEAKEPDERALLASLASGDRIALALRQLETLLPEAHEHIQQLEHEIDLAHTRGPLYTFTPEELQAEAAHEKKNKHAVHAVPWSATSHAPAEKLRARQQHLGALRNRARHWLQILHRIYQFSGHAYFQQTSHKTDAKQDSSTQEEDAYAQAEATRQRLLTDARLAVEQSVREMHSQRRVSLTELSPRMGVHGLAGRSLLETVQARLATLCAHAALVVDWRDQITARLSKPVNRAVDKDEANDDVYAENLDAQIEAETLLEMYRPLLAQRDELLTGRIALGATARPQLFLELDRALRIAKTRLFGAVEEEEESEERQAQRLQLKHFHRLDAQRARVGLAPGAPPLSALLPLLREARETATRADDIRSLSLAYTHLQDIVRTQTPLVERLRKEQASLQACFNARSLYFKQMQELSDQVQDPEIAEGPVPSLLHALAQERAWKVRIAAMEGRVRYLEHLEEIQGGHAEDDARVCFICTNPIETGILTNACGHLCCHTCFYAWMKQGRRTCPMCKTRLALNDVHRVVYRRDAAEAGETGRVPSAPQTYRVLPDALRIEIEQIPSEGRYGSKLDLLVKHLLYLRRTTGEKSLVFSSFARGLDLVAESLRANGVRYARLEGGGSSKVGETVAQFQTDPELPILLLHSEVQSAGLNLVAATRLFVLEPLMNHALELQAIGRVHRIGQTRETHVYCYMVNETVEQRIVALAASRGQCVYLSQDANTVDSAALQASQLAHVGSDVSREARKGDLLGSTDDLLACLFQAHIPGDDTGQAGADTKSMGMEELRARRLASLA